MQIKDLVNKSKEGRIVMENFAARKRVHKDKAVDIKRLYFILHDRVPSLNQAAFDQVFKDLEQMGHGVLDKGRYFHPEGSIRDIGLEAIPEPVVNTVKVTPEVNHNKVVVLFKLQGLRCRAEVPEEALPLFEKLVNL